jgi:nucleoside-diphosphate-sugar epimerase
MPKPTLLITGINGLIGGVLKKPLEERYRVYGCDLVGPFSDRVFQVDISQEEEVRGLFQEHGPFPFLIHLAANPRVDAPWEEVLQANIVGTRNVYHAAQRYETRRVIFPSSNHVTGAYEGFPPQLHHNKDPRKISPSDPIRPDSEYGVSKAFGEALARYYRERWGLASICLRIGSVLEDDDPTRDPRHAKTWLSHRDLVQLVSKGLMSDVGFGIYYGVSDNTGRFWSLSNARRDLGYQPQDNAGEAL